MEEKERYELVEEDFAYAIVDNEEHKTYQQDCFDFGNICDLLNQQSKRIKELEQENKKVKINNYLADYYLVEQENQQLKQQLAEKEKENDTLTAKLEQANEIINNPDTLIFQQQELIDNLQSQLAEKERQLKLAEELLIKQEKEYDEQLHDLPKKIVEEIRKELNNIVEVGDYFDTETDEETNLLKQSDIENILDTILKKYGGEDEKRKSWKKI